MVLSASAVTALLKSTATIKRCSKQIKADVDDLLTGWCFGNLLYNAPLFAMMLLG
jgi:hypothetical protein